jgi:hypothetical protein
MLKASVIQTSVIITSSSNIVIITTGSVSTVHAITVHFSVLLSNRSDKRENNREQEQAMKQTKHHGQHKNLQEEDEPDTDVTSW